SRRSPARRSLRQCSRLRPASTPGRAANGERHHAPVAACPMTPWRTQHAWPRRHRTLISLEAITWGDFAFLRSSLALAVFRRSTGTIPAPSTPGAPSNERAVAARGRRAKRSTSSGSSARPTSTTSRASGGGSESNALPPPNVSARAGLALALQPHLPHEVALAEWHALHAQDVVRGRRVEVEVAQRERQEESIGRERHLEVAELEDDVPPFERIHLRGRYLLQRLPRGADELLQPAIVVRGGLRRRLEEAFLRSLDGAERMVRDRLQLEPERHHIGEEPGLDDLVEVAPVGGEVRAALLEEADDGPQRLQVTRYAQVVECDRHGGTSRRAVSSAHAGTTRAVGDGAGATTIRLPSPC